VVPITSTASRVLEVACTATVVPTEQGAHHQLTMRSCI